MSIAFPMPDEGVLARRDEILTGLAHLVAPEALVVSEDERRAFETDALTAYRKMPLAVVLPSTTGEMSEVLKFCHAHGTKVVPRGAGRETLTAMRRARLPAPTRVGAPRGPRTHGRTWSALVSCSDRAPSRASSFSVGSLFTDRERRACTKKSSP